MAPYPRKKLKVGIFVEGKFLPSYDGASNRFHYLSRFLQKSGAVDIVVFHCHRGYTDIALLKKEKFTTYLLSEENYYHNIGLLASLIKSEHIDILQFNDAEPLLSLGIRLSNMTNTKLIYEIHYNPIQLAKTLGEKDTVIDEMITTQSVVGATIDHAICLSTDDKKYCIEDLHIREDTLSIIPSGVDLGENKYHTPNLKNKSIVFLGNLYFQPNEDAVRILKDAIYPKLVDAGFSFVIAGDCPEKLKSELETDNFTFIGTLQNLNQLYKNAALCVAPILEGTGIRIKFLNFMSGGIPILTTEIATNGFSDKSVFLIENDIEKYADIILDLFQLKKLAAISKRSRTYVERNFSWVRIAAITSKTYQEVVRKETNKKKTIANSFGKPVWLKELVTKGRYQIVSQLPDHFSFSKVQNGEICHSAIEAVIAIEGMPGAGKTTFATNLHNPDMKVIWELQVKVPKKVTSSFEIQKRYLSAEKGKYDSIFEHAETDKKIILDRSFISTVAYCYADCKAKNDMNDYVKLLQLLENGQFKMVFPTKVIIFDCSIDESIYRRRKFQNNPEFKKWFDISFLTYLNEFYHTELSKIISAETITIDTTNRTIAEVAAIAKEML